MRTLQLLVAAIFDTAASARIIAADKAPYHLSSLNKRAVNLDFNEDVIKLGPESAIHKRIAKQIWPDYITARKQRRAVPSDDGSPRAQLIQGVKGATFLSDSKTAIDRQNPSHLTPPKTDAGVIPKLKWSFSLSHTRILKGGWIREQTPIAIVGHILLVISALPSVIADRAGAMACFSIAFIVMGGNLIALLVAEQVTTRKMFISVLKSGERVIVDPALTIARIFL
ncbi:hypothetical protein V8E36_007129 [Tilletia maclaganii]